MSKDPRQQLERFIAALEQHLEAITSSRGEGDSSVEQAYYQVEDAFLGYEESLSENFGEYLPIALAEDDQ